MNRIFALPMICLAILASTAKADPRQSKSSDSEYFERKIRPLLDEHCFSCHSQQAKTVHGGLRLDSAADLRIGGDSGAAIVAGNPEESLLIQAIRYDGELQMPPEGKLSDLEIAELTAWIKRGAPYPASPEPSDHVGGQIDFQAGRAFWSFQRVREQPLPKLADESWPQQRIDAFVLAAMQRQGLKPSRPASRATLIRRVYFDLIGLPPEPEQVRAFVDDPSPIAYERLVNRLLNSPQYGEKWARLWLDLARYTDRTASWLYKNGQPHLYRDWVVQALNDDMPYDQFVHRQLATDMMPETGPEDLPALGFIGLSPAYWKELKLPCEIIKVIVADEWEERVDATTRTFLGLTVACARCHDHKFDPISSEDYYGLAGVFASCRQQELPLIDQQLYEPVRKAKAEIEQLGVELAKLQQTKPKEGSDQQKKIDELKSKIAGLKSTPHFDTPLASAVVDESLYVVRAGKLPEQGTRLDYRPGPKDLPLFVRGNPNRPGPIVQRRFLTVLSADPRPFSKGSGRLELAKAITTEAAPLAARVIVNRIWHAHFGQGIVATPSNFGQQGERPTHPDLLDDLAARFIAGGWSIKALHREILLSATWQQASTDNDQAAAIDANNRWLSRMNRRRLEFEAWRDAMLAVTHELDQTIGGPSVELDDSANLRRTVYATVHRRDMSTTLQIHDFPDPTAHSPMRSNTTTALQGLYALNGPLLTARAEALVNRLLADEPAEDESRIDRAYWLLFARAPSQQDKAIGLTFLGRTSGDERLAAWRQYAHALLACNEFLFLD